MEKQLHTKRQLPNKYIYISFLIAAIIFACLEDYGTTIIFGGIGLAFDPFDQQTSFRDRPLWQRALLIVHVLFVLVFIFLSVIKFG